MDTPRRRGSAVLLALGAFAALLGLAALGGGGGLLVLQAVGEDADGFLTSGEVDLTTGTRALVSENLDMWAGAGPDEWTPQLGDVTLRVEVTPPTTERCSSASDPPTRSPTTSTASTTRC